MASKTGSETLGASSDKNKMTLFKDDRAEDVGAIIVSALVVAYIMMVTTGKAPAPAPAPSAPAVATAPAIPAAPATPVTK